MTERDRARRVVEELRERAKRAATTCRLQAYSEAAELVARAFKVKDARA